MFDLDIRRITDFKLKPWADRFLTIRATLYEYDNDGDSGDSGANSGGNAGHTGEIEQLNDNTDHSAFVKGVFTDTVQTPVWGIACLKS